MRLVVLMGSRSRNGVSAFVSISATLPQNSLYSVNANLCFGPLILMQKTKKSVAKRFKLTAKGKLLHRSPGTRHIANTKSSKQKRRLGRAKTLSETHAVPLKRCLPHGL